MRILILTFHITIFLFSFLTVHSQFRCDIADNCIDIKFNQKIGPTNTDPNCGAFEIFSAKGCLLDANPETSINVCGSDTLPTVWFQVTVDEAAVQLITFVSPKRKGWTPIWSVYYGSCNNLKLLKGGSIENPISCSNGDSNIAEHSVGLVEGYNTYYLAISGEGEIDDPEFSIDLYTSAGCVSCIGGDIGCTTNAKFQIEKRSSGRPLNDPLFSQGETVTVCSEFKYDASSTSSDWLHGIIPDFDEGWDIDIFNPQSIVSNFGAPEWKEDDFSNCYPTVTEQMPLLCTYTDPKTGKLRLCNIACETCPCSAPLLTGSKLPSGWFWSQNGGDGCGNYCAPKSSFGIGSIYVNLKFCIDLKVKVFSDIQDCYNNRSLKYKFNTLSHGVSGCYNDPVAECKLDKIQFGPNWNIDCNALDTCFVVVRDTIITTVYDTIVRTVFDTTEVTIVKNIAVTDTLIINLNIPISNNQITENKITIYPNPASSFLIIDNGDFSLMENYEIQILNAVGQPVYFTPIEQKIYTIDLNGWGGKGTYFLKIKNPNGATIQTKKIVLQ